MSILIYITKKPINFLSFSHRKIVASKHKILPKSLCILFISSVHFRSFFTKSTCKICEFFAVAADDSITAAAAAAANTTAATPRWSSPCRGDGACSPRSSNQSASTRRAQPIVAAKAVRPTDLLNHVKT